MAESIAPIVKIDIEFNSSAVAMDAVPELAGAAEIHGFDYA